MNASCIRVAIVLAHVDLGAGGGMGAAAASGVIAAIEGRTGYIVE